MYTSVDQSINKRSELNNDIESVLNQRVDPEVLAKSLFSKGMEEIQSNYECNIESAKAALAKAEVVKAQEIEALKRKFVATKNLYNDDLVLYFAGGETATISSVELHELGYTHPFMSEEQRKYNIQRAHAQRVAVVPVEAPPTQEDLELEALANELDSNYAPRHTVRREDAAKGMQELLEYRQQFGAFLGHNGQWAHGSHDLAAVEATNS